MVPGFSIANRTMSLFGSFYMRNERKGFFVRSMDNCFTRIWWISSMIRLVLRDIRSSSGFLIEWTTKEIQSSIFFSLYFFRSCSICRVNLWIERTLLRFTDFSSSITLKKCQKWIESFFHQLFEMHTLLLNEIKLIWNKTMKRLFWFKQKRRCWFFVIYLFLSRNNFRFFRFFFLVRPEIVLIILFRILKQIVSYENLENSVSTFNKSLFSIADSTCSSFFSRSIRCCNSRYFFFRIFWIFWKKRNFSKSFSVW